MGKDKSIALDIGGTRIKIATLSGDVVQDLAIIPSNSQGLLADRLDDIEEEIKKLTNGDYSQYCGVGVALPCLVDPAKKRATEIYSKFEDAPDLDLESWCMRAFNLPMAMEQDSKAALLGEMHYGSGKGYENGVMVIMGTGIGTAVMINSKLLSSRNHLAGAIGGHIIVDIENSRKCTCKNYGCLEAYASSWALPEIVKENPDFENSILKNVQTINFFELEKAVIADDKVAKQTLDLVIKAMRAGIISFVHSYDPNVVILSGGPLNMGEMFTKPLLENITDFMWGCGEKVEIKIAQNPDESVLLGLNYLIKEQTK